MRKYRQYSHTYIQYGQRIQYIQYRQNNIRQKNTEYIQYSPARKQDITETTGNTYKPDKTEKTDKKENTHKSDMHTG